MRRLLPAILLLLPLLAGLGLYAKVEGPDGSLTDLALRRAQADTEPGDLATAVPFTTPAPADQATPTPVVVPVEVLATQTPVPAEVGPTALPPSTVPQEQTRGQIRERQRRFRRRRHRIRPSVGRPFIRITAISAAQTIRRSSNWRNELRTYIIAWPSKPIGLQ